MDLKQETRARAEMVLYMLNDMLLFIAAKEASRKLRFWRARARNSARAGISRYTSIGLDVPDRAN